MNKSALIKVKLFNIMNLSKAIQRLDDNIMLLDEIPYTSKSLKELKHSYEHELNKTIMEVLKLYEEK